MADSGEISRLKSEISYLRSRKSKCEDAITKMTGVIGFIVSGSKELIAAKEYMSDEYDGKSINKMIENLESYEEISNDLKSDAQACVAALKELKSSLESQIREKKRLLEALEMESSES